MKTVIVRLRERNSDLLGELDDDSSVSRMEAYDRLQKEFWEASVEVRSFLADKHEQTLRRYNRNLDILSEDISTESDVLHYQPLLPSHSLAVTATDDVIKELARCEQIDGVHENYVYELPENETDTSDIAEEDLSAGGLGAAATREWHLARIEAAAARQRTDGGSVKVAVLDTGLDVLHREFDHMRDTGKIASWMEWDAIGMPRQTASPLSETHRESHGTHVTGILCGKNVGLAPGIELYVGIIAPRGSATFAQIDMGLDWAARNDVDLVSLSVGKPGYRTEWENSTAFVNRTKMLVVAAIGNDGPGTHRSPGDYKVVFSVGATDAQDQAWVSRKNGQRASAGDLIAVSQLAPYRKPDVYAPGAEIYSSIQQNQYTTMSGTSMATPTVTGVAALIKSLCPTISPTDLRDHIVQYSDRISLPTTLGACGWRVSAKRAVAAIP